MADQNSHEHGEVETASRFPLLHTPDGGYLNSERVAVRRRGVVFQAGELHELRDIDLVGAACLGLVMLASHSNSGGISTRALNSAGVNVLFTDRNQVICYDPPPPRLSFKRDNAERF